MESSCLVLPHSQRGFSTQSSGFRTSRTGEHQNRRVAGGGVGGSAHVEVVGGGADGVPAWPGGFLPVPVVVIRTPKRDDPGRIVDPQLQSH